MKKTLSAIFVMLILISSFAYADASIDLIEKNVDKEYRQTAISLIQKSEIGKVEIVNNRVVINLKTDDKYFEVKVSNGFDSFSKRKSLGTVKIPFPKNGDVEKCFGDSTCPSRDYLNMLNEYGIYQLAGKTISADHMAFYFMNIKYRSLIKANQNVHIGFRLTKDGNSFDGSNETNFFVQACDQSACWGANGVSLKLKQW